MKAMSAHLFEGRDDVLAWFVQAIYSAVMVRVVILRLQA